MSPEHLQLICKSDELAQSKAVEFGLTQAEIDRFHLLQYITELTICSWCGGSRDHYCQKCSEPEKPVAIPTASIRWRREEYDEPIQGQAGIVIARTRLILQQAFLVKGNIEWRDVPIEEIL